MDIPESDRCAELFKALSEPIRLRIVDVLRDGPKCVGELVDILHIDIVNVSHHLGILKNAGIADRRRDGRKIVYRLAADVFTAGSEADSSDHLDLGCCRLELPKDATESSGKSHRPNASLARHA